MFLNVQKIILLFAFSWTSANAIEWIEDSEPEGFLNENNRNEGTQLRRIRRGTNFAEDKDIQWPSPIIYYEKYGIDDDKKLKEILEAMRVWEKETCVRFRQVSLETRFQHQNVLEVQLTSNDRCSSGIGIYKFNIFRGQMLYVGPKCSTYKIVHELGHTLGLYHEHSRPDRDAHVRINWYNVDQSKVDDKWQMQMIPDLDTKELPYDFGSIMHYSAYHKSIRAGAVTIEPKNELYRDTIGQRQQLSFLDAKEVNTLYCSDTCHNIEQFCYYGGYTDPNHCDRCKCPEGLGGRNCEKLQQSTKHVKQCGGEFTVENEWSFFNFNSTEATNCYWRISHKLAHKKILFFFIGIEFNCPKFEPCSEFVEVKHGAEFETTGYRICCDRPDAKYSVVSETNVMLLIFKGPGSFEIQFSTYEEKEESKLKWPARNQIKRNQ